jgi:arabinan endo-1,5-alpha-L-arabinosidase
MKSRIVIIGAVALASLFASKTVSAQVGAPYIHDPSTIMECDGKYYTFGTGGGGLISEDGWNWHSGAVRPGGGQPLTPSRSATAT